MKNRLLALAGALALLAVLGEFCTKPVVAQVRAALVANVDEPTRSPYQVVSDTNCTTSICDVAINLVSDTKRLRAAALIAPLGKGA
jgi:hypothetical protein